MSLERPSGSLQSLLSKSECDINPEMYWSMDGPGVSLREICTEEQLQTSVGGSGILKLSGEAASAESGCTVRLFSTLHYIHDLDI